MAPWASLRTHPSHRPCGFLFPVSHWATFLAGDSSPATAINNPSGGRVWANGSGGEGPGRARWRPGRPGAGGGENGNSSQPARLATLPFPRATPLHLECPLGLFPSSSGATGPQRLPQPGSAAVGGTAQAHTAWRLSRWDLNSGQQDSSWHQTPALSVGPPRITPATQELGAGPGSLHPLPRPPPPHPPHSPEPESHQPATRTSRPGHREGQIGNFSRGHRASKFSLV